LALGDVHASSLPTRITWCLVSGETATNQAPLRGISAAARLARGVRWQSVSPRGRLARTARKDLTPAPHRTAVNRRGPGGITGTVGSITHNVNVNLTVK